MDVYRKGNQGLSAGQPKPQNIEQGMPEEEEEDRHEKAQEDTKNQV
jgi:hypothetical protein